MTSRSTSLLRRHAFSIALLASALAVAGFFVSGASLSFPGLIWLLVLLLCLLLAYERIGAGRGRQEVEEVATPLRREPVLSEALSETQPERAFEFLSSAGHDLRQPMQAISLYAATLATHPLPDASKQLVAGLEAASETLSIQFEEVMAITKLASGRTAPDYKTVMLGAILSSTVAEHLGDAHDKGLHLRCVGSSLRVGADETLLACAVSRLVAHAVRTTESGGVLIGCRRRADAVLLELRDSSGGVAPALQAEVFKPFSNYGQRHADRALGLVLADRIVQRLGGTLSLKTVAGRGNIYTIRLPRLTGAGPK